MGADDDIRQLLVELRERNAGDFAVAYRVAELPDEMRGWNGRG